MTETTRQHSDQRKRWSSSCRGAARRRNQQAGDRRFNRRKYHAAQTIEAYSVRLRDQLDLDTLSAELLAVDEAAGAVRRSPWSVTNAVTASAAENYMRAIWITRHGGPEVLEVRETADPKPGAGQVRIRVCAAGLNFAKVMARQGLYPDAPKPPCVLGYETAGVVDALGPGVVGPVVGQRVAALVRFGAHAEAVCVPAEQTMNLPEGTSFEEAAALPVNYLTAYHMLFRVAGIRAGERVLVHMAAGGVGIAVLQLCRTVDGVVTFGTASAAKHEVLRAEGCTYPIDYRRVDYAAEVRRLTAGEGVDVVLDPLGGHDWKRGLALLRPVGRLVAFGFANLTSGERRRPLRVAWQALRVPVVTPLGLMARNRTICGVNIGHLWDERALLREELEAVAALWRAGRLKPRVDAVYPFTDAAAAHRSITERRNIGKVILVP